jgi:predicted MPP superfamily phosphohydrolase
MKSWMSFLLFRLIATFTMLLITAGISSLIVRRLFPNAWQKWAKKAFLVGIAAAFVGSLAWLSGRTLDILPLNLGGMVVMSTLLVTSVILFMASPVWGLVGWGTKKLAARMEATDVDPQRRLFLARAGGVLPLAAVGSGPAGTAASVLQLGVTEVEVPIAGLPPALDGLSILQLTDVHLGTFIDVDQVQRAVDAVKDRGIDLVVLTGDIADDYDKLGPALDAICTLEPTLGSYAIYGNHEVYRGRERCHDIYAGSRVKLLREDGVVLEKDGAKLWLGGCDDPATLGEEHRSFLAKTVQNTVATRPEGVDASILLSHRPEGFEEAARQGIDLTLAGHTHGGQVAVFGRSVFSPMLPESYLLGPYTSGSSHLYTSAGLGHWFPFRLNCPCEAAVITLKRGKGNARVV